VAELAILIVSYNARAELEGCLQSLRKHPPQIPHEILVVDNASSDGSREFVRSGGSDVRLIENTTNVGFARANNIGFRETRSELVLLLNSDTLVPEGAIDRLVDELRSRPDAAAIGPRLKDEHGASELSFGGMLSPFAELTRKSIAGLARRGFPPALRWVESATSRPQSVDWVSGACLLVRRADAEAAGLLDERYFMYCEDVDFCSAIRGLGRKVLFTPAADVIHLRGRSVAAAPASTERAYRLSQIAFYTKHHPAWVPWLRAYLRLRGKLPAESADK
jgi:GT2 family glycosyltransferase